MKIGGRACARPPIVCWQACEAVQSLRAVSPRAEKDRKIAGVDDTAAVEIGTSRPAPRTKEDSEIRSVHDVVAVEITQAPPAAETLRSVDAEAVPRDIAAEGIGRAHGIAARRVIAERPARREAAS